jgi:adenylate cyclase
VAVAGVHQGEVFTLAAHTTIGREVTNTIVLDRDTAASRHHAEIREEGGRFLLRDLQSSNGTFVNGGRVEELPLEPGDEVRVGRSSFRFEG